MPIILLGTLDTKGSSFSLCVDLMKAQGLG